MRSTPARRLFQLLLCLMAGGLQADPVRVIATNPVLLDWVRQVGGEAVDARLAGASGDFHNFDPTPADLRRLAQAELVIANGAGLEPWLDRFFRSSGTRARRLDASTGLPLMQAGSTLRLVASSPDTPVPSCCAPDSPTPPATAGLSVEVIPPRDHAHHHPHSGPCDHGHLDPHLWLDPRLAQGVVTMIADVLGELRPAHADTFGERAEAYASRLAELDRWIEAELEEVPAERRVLVTYHHAFAYFARRYQLALPGSLLGSVHSEVREPGARAAARFTAFVREHRLPAIFGEHGQDDRLLQELGRQAGVRVAWLYAEALPGDEPTYEGMMRHNARTIRAALTPDS